MSRRHHGLKQSKESKTTKYWVRAMKRIIKVLIWLFILFVIVMGLVYIVPKIWHFVLG